MEIYKLTNSEWMEKVTSYIAGGVHCIAYGIQDSPVVLTHRKTQVDETLCNSLGYAVYEERAGMNLYHKKGGAWKQTQTAYEKRSGVWIEITEDECREILQNNFLSSESS